MHRCQHSFKNIPSNLWVVRVGSNSFQGISYAGKPQVVSRCILSNLWSNIYWHTSDKINQLSIGVNIIYFCKIQLHKKILITMKSSLCSQHQAFHIQTCRIIIGMNAFNHINRLWTRFEIVHFYQTQLHKHSFRRMKSYLSIKPSTFNLVSY